VCETSNERRPPCALFMGSRASALPVRIATEQRSTCALLTGSEQSMLPLRTAPVQTTRQAKHDSLSTASRAEKIMISRVAKPVNCTRQIQLAARTRSQVATAHVHTHAASMRTACLSRAKTCTNERRHVQKSANTAAARATAQQLTTHTTSTATRQRRLFQRSASVVSVLLAVGTRAVSTLGTRLGRVMRL
jgi:Na+-translocating ferredoxin:NAD+ oxidoreductase RNF subunit RnfB